ncbi:MAG: hypothetical protein ACTHNW_19645 [Mucilaginibacter sp.]
MPGDFFTNTINTLKAISTIAENIEKDIDFSIDKIIVASDALNQMVKIIETEIEYKEVTGRWPWDCFDNQIKNN